MSEKPWHILYIHHPFNVSKVKEVFDKLHILHTLWHPEQGIIHRENPALDNKKGRGRRFKALMAKKKPVFYGYAFAQFDYPGEFLDAALKESKVGYILKPAGSDLPATVDNEFIQRIVELCKKRVDITTEKYGKFYVDQPVEVINGPFLRQHGIILAVKTKTVLLDLHIFERNTVVEVNKSDIGAIEVSDDEEIQ